MKKLIFLSLVILIFSCNSIPTKIENPKQETTLELQELAKADTICYKLVIINTKHYLLNSNNQVEYIINNQSGEYQFFITGFLILFFLFFMSIAFILNTI